MGKSWTFHGYHGCRVMKLNPQCLSKNVDIFKREPRYFNGMFGILKNDSLSKLA